MLGYNSDFNWMNYNRVTKTKSGSNIDNTSNLIYGTEYGEAPSNGNDVIVAGSGNDRIYANGGNDVIAGGAGNDTMNGGWGNDTFFFEKGSGNDTISDFGHSASGNLDQIVVEGTYLGSSSSFLGTTLKFDFDGDTKADASVLLLGVSASSWKTYMKEGALVDASTAAGAVQVQQVHDLVHHDYLLPA